jgi:hypothetical protein
MVAMVQEDYHYLQRKSLSSQSTCSGRYLSGQESGCVADAMIWVTELVNTTSLTDNRRGWLKHDNDEFKGTNNFQGF